MAGIGEAGKTKQEEEQPKEGVGTEGPSAVPAFLPWVHYLQTGNSQLSSPFLQGSVLEGIRMLPLE